MAITHNSSRSQSLPTIPNKYILKMGILLNVCSKTRSFYDESIEFNFHEVGLFIVFSSEMCVCVCVCA